MSRAGYMSMGSNLNLCHPYHIPSQECSPPVWVLPQPLPKQVWVLPQPHCLSYFNPYGINPLWMNSIVHPRTMKDLTCKSDSMKTLQFGPLENLHIGLTLLANFLIMPLNLTANTHEIIRHLVQCTFRI